uniref:Uncharacterized protein n=1 Tax=viral metagenome TaxID=1070528 RepID=A0A6C0JWF8_9ZZZZ
MSSVNSYMFNNMGRIGTDVTDKTQQTLYNTRIANYNLSNYFSSDKSDNHVLFATMQPSVTYNGVNGGSGVGGGVVDYESLLLNQSEQERPLEKVQLTQRMFVTVPYLGRGAGNTDIESQLQQGEIIDHKKSTSTIMEKSFMPYSLPVTDYNMNERVANPAYTVEEVAMEGWVRGGADARNLSYKK